MKRSHRLGLYAAAAVAFMALAALADPLPPDASYRPLPTLPFGAVKANDEAAKPAVMQRQQTLLEQRYDLGDQPDTGTDDVGRAQAGTGRHPGQVAGRGYLGRLCRDDPRSDPRARPVSERLPADAACQAGNRGQVFPNTQINEIRSQEARNLQRFDVDFDLPDHLTPEFPPPIFLTTHPELGDVSGGKLLTIKNYYDQMVGILTPVQTRGPQDAADAVPAGGVQPDRGPQERRPEPGRDLS